MVNNKEEVFMKFLNTFVIFIYTLFFSVIGAFLIGISVRAESFDIVIKNIGYLYQTYDLKPGLAAAGFLLMLINVYIARITIGGTRKPKTIAFENPDGQVTLSLSAIEDYIKKLTNKMTEIREIKSAITAGKRGVEITAKTALYADINIPETTEKIQGLIRSRLQEMLGLDEKVTIKVHVSKLVHREKDKMKEPECGGFKGEINYDEGGK
jgi:uncharacterized alkaline shock family protein YloU